MKTYGSTDENAQNGSTSSHSEEQQHTGALSAECNETTSLLKSEDIEHSSQNNILEEPVYNDKFVYLCFLILGLGTLLPWNVFITAEPYWQYKFRNITSNKSIPVVMKQHTPLQNLFTPMEVSFAQVVNFGFLFINALYSHLISQQKRLLNSLLLMLGFFTLTTVFVKINTDEWQLTFFIITLVIIVLLNAAGAIFQGGLFGLAGRFPLIYINAVGQGLSISGIFTSVAQIASAYFGADPVTAAFIYFMIAVFVMVFTLVIYLLVSRRPFFKYYANPRPTREGDVHHPSRSLKDTFRVFKLIWRYALSVCVVYFVTLSVFPVVNVRILSSSTNKVWATKYFQRVITFLVYNLGDFTGRFLAEKILLPSSNSILLHIGVFARLTFIPLFLLCNHDPHSPIPSVFVNDLWYLAFMIMFSLSNGYLSALLMMYAPRVVSEADSEKAASLIAASLGLGLLLGASASFLFALI